MRRYKPGDAISDTWTVTDALGSGAMGSVYLCRNALLSGVQAAVKVLPVYRDDHDGLARVEREVEALGRLRHPNIVGLRGFGTDGPEGPCWIAMDFVVGDDLAAVLDGGRPVHADVIAWFTGLVDALRHAHGHGVFHRDIKPANIVITQHGPVLVDWGVVLHGDLSRLTRTGQVPGTVPYFAPEVFQPGLGRVQPDKSDLYALGVVLHECLTGVPAFPYDPDLTSEQNSARVMQTKLLAQRLDPGPTVHSALRTLVAGLTEPGPAARLADFHRMLELLEAARRPDDGGNDVVDGTPGDAGSGLPETWEDAPRSIPAPSDPRSEQLQATLERHARIPPPSLADRLVEIAAAALFLAALAYGGSILWGGEGIQFADFDLPKPGEPQAPRP